MGVGETSGLDGVVDPGDPFPGWKDCLRGVGGNQPARPAEGIEAVRAGAAGVGCRGSCSVRILICFHILQGA